MPGIAEHAVDHIADVNEQLDADETFPKVHSVRQLAIMLSAVLERAHPAKAPEQAVGA